jgi:hypothetical protein
MKEKALSSFWHMVFSLVRTCISTTVEVEFFELYLSHGFVEEPHHPPMQMSDVFSMPSTPRLKSPATGHELGCRSLTSQSL